MKGDFFDGSKEEDRFDRNCKFPRLYPLGKRPCHRTGSTGTETVLLNIEVIAVLCLDMIAFSFNFAVEKAQFLQKTLSWTLSNIIR
jgi:hypothetical protein